jgi:predicted Zn-dependent peptidase
MTTWKLCLLQYTEFVEPLNPATLGQKTPLNVLPERIPAVTGTLPSASHVSVAQVKNVTFVAVDEPRPVSTMSLFVKAGSRYEDETTAGSAHFLKRLAFNSTEKKYFYPLILDLDKQGIEYESLASREFVSYSLTGLRSDNALMAETLGAVQQPRLEEWEIRAAREQVLAEIATNSSNGRQTLLDAIHREAFRDQGLGNSPNAAPFQAESLSFANLRQYVNTHYTSDRLIVVATGANIEELKSHAEVFEPFDVKATIAAAIGPGLERYFPIVGEPKPIHANKSIYTGGGQTRLPGLGATQIIVAAEGVGAAAGSSSQIAAAILQTILGGGSSALRSIVPSFKQSRLGKTVGSSDGWLEYAEAFHLSYSDAGLFGVFAQAQHGNAARVAETLAKQFQNLPAISDAEVLRAKAQLKANLFATFSSDAHALTEFYASQVANTGAALTPTQYAAQIDTIDTAAVVAVAKKVAASKLTVAALGDLKGLPQF